MTKYYFIYKNGATYFRDMDGNFYFIKLNELFKEF